MAMDPDKRPQAGEIEERQAPELETDGKRIRGRIPYNVESRDLGGWREIIEPGALNRADLGDLVVTVDHVGLPLGRYPTTLTVEDRDDAMHWSVDPPASRADVREAIERGDLKGGSWRMIVGQDEWRGDVRHVREIKALRDVAIVTTGAYPAEAAAVEYRSEPGEAQEVTTMGTEPEQQQEQQQEDRSQPTGGLHVEDRVEVVPTRRPFFEEIAVAAREVSIGEARSLTTAVSLSNPEYSVQFFDALRPASAFLRSGVQTLTTSSDTVVYPVLTSDPTIGWVSEGGTITASDPGLGAGTAIPHKLSVRTEYSNELMEDSAPGIEQILRQVLVARAGIVIDTAAFQGGGAAPEPLGMANVVGIGTVNASGAGTSVAWAANAVAALEASYAPRPYVWVSGTALVKDLREVRAGTTQDSYMFPPSSPDLPVLYGASGFLAPALVAGTVHVYSPSSCYVVNRTSGLDVEINRARLFDSDRSEMRLRARLDYFYPYPGAIRKGTGIP